jgi:hypothetical protein
MKKSLLALAIALAPSLAWAQGAVLQNGSVIKFDLPGWVQDKTIMSGGKMFTDNFRGFNSAHFFDNHGPGVCTEDALTNGPYHQICMGHDANGLATINVTANNGAAAQGINFNINGTTYAFPGAGNGNVVGPLASVVNSLALFNGTGGTPLKDSGIIIGSPIGRGAVCNGSTDDTTAFINAFADSKLILMSGGVTCAVNNLVLSGGRTLDCNGAKLTAASGSLWVIKKTGGSVIRNCVIDDPLFRNVVASTLNGAVSPGASSFNLNAATGFQNGMPINILLQSGAYYTTKIKPVNGITGNNVTITGKVPASATGVAIIAGGAGCTTAATLVVQGGRGPPTTLQVTSVSGGAVTGVSIRSPGLYETAPGAGASAVSHNVPACLGVTVTLTTAGALNNAAVEGSWGSLIVDGSQIGGIENVTLGSVYAGIGYYATTTDVNNPTQQEYAKDFSVQASKFFGLWVGAGVNTINFTNAYLWGQPHGASGFGSTGFVRDYEQPTAAFPSGGNQFTNINVLGWETGYLLVESNRDFYNNIVSDTNRNYSTVCNGCNTNMWSTLTWSGETGGTSFAATSKGVGMVWGAYTGQDGVTYPASVNSVGGYVGGDNAADMYFADAYQDGTGTGASLYLTPNLNGTFGLMLLSGKTWAIVNATNLVAGRTLVTGGGGITFNFGQGLGQSGTEADTLSPVAGRHVITQSICSADGPAGVGEQYVCILRYAGGTGLSGEVGGAGGGGGSVIELGRCQILNPNTYCVIPGPGFAVLNGDIMGWQVVSSGGAASRRFRGMISGL